MGTCANCGSDNRPGAGFCANCGTPLRLRCTGCGEPLPDGARFCPSCGTPAAGPDAQPTAARAQERRVVTLLFADVTGSTALGERLDPERLHEVLEVYFDAMRREIEAEGGTTEKFIGDAIVAAFGVPVAHEDDPARALRAALRMQERLSDVNDRLRERHDVALQIRIGVNTGEVLTVVDPVPGEPMFTGDAVNVAARFEQAAEPGEVLTSERTARAGRGFAYEDRGWIELKGKRDRFKAYRVLEELGGPARGVPGLRSPMVGRGAELGLLQSVYERLAAEGRPHLVTIYGDAGVGKSRLTQEFQQWSEDREPPPLVVRGRCLPYGESVTYWPLAEILKSHAGVLDSDPPDLTLEKIRKSGRDLLTSEWAPDPARATAALALTLGVEDPDVSFATLDPRDVRSTVHAAWRSFFSALAGDGPLLTIVEDIHWAEPPLLDLLEDLADRVQGPAMFVCPSRPDLLATRPAWGGGRRNMSSVSLDPLGVDDAERLIGHLLEIDDLPGSVRAAILARAEGNPFFLEEIIRRLIDEGLVVLEQGRWRATAGIAEVEIPDTVQAVLAARIDLLDAEDRRVLQAASVVGRVFWPGPVASLMGAARPGDLDERFRRLEERELVQSRLSSSLAGQPELIFKHILTRDVAYASIPRRERAAAHRTVGAWIERTAGDRVREFVELLAHHYGTAVTLQAETGEVDEVVRRSAFVALTQASIDARHKEVLAKAQRLADDALAIARGDPERADALEALGEAFFEDYRGDLAWRYLREAALTQLRIEPLDRVRIAYLASRACDLPVRWPGSMREIPDADDVRSLLAAGMDQLLPGDSAERVMLMSNRAGWPFAFPDLQGPDELALAERSGLEAAAMAERLGRYDLASAALDQAQGALASVGMYGRAIELIGERAKVVPFLEDTFEIGDFYAMGAWSHYEVGRYREALRFCEEGSAFAVGHPANAEVHSLSWRVVTRYRVGEWDGALEDHERLRSRLDDRRDEPPYFASHAFAVAATIMALRGETAASDELTEIVRRVASGGAAARARAWFVRLLLERGELEDAHRAFDDRPPTWRVHRPDEEEVRMELLAAGGDWTSTEDVLAEARTYAAESGVAALPWFADRHEGRAALARGDLEVALARLETAADGFSAIEATWERARTDLDLARALAAAGRSADAVARASAAGSVFASLGAVKDAEAARELAGRW